MKNLKRRTTCLAVLILFALVGCKGDNGEDEAAEAVAAESTEESSDEDETLDEDDKKEDAEAKDEEVAEAEDDGNDGQDDEAEGEDEQEVSEGEQEEGEDEEDIETASEERSVDDFKHLAFYATGPVAVIDGESIDAHVFNEIAELQLSAIPSEVMETQGEAIKAMLIQGLVVSHLIEREIAKKNIRVSTDEVNTAMQAQERMLLQQFEGDRAQMNRALRQQGITDEVMREQMERELAAKKLVTQGRDVSISDGELRQAYEQLRSHLNQPEQARAHHILLYVEDEEQDDAVRQRAEGFARQLRDGEAQIGDLAREHSDCPSASQGGDLGYFTRDSLMTEFTSVAFEMEPGSISDPVRSNLGWHVIRMDERLEAQSASFEDIREELEMMLQMERIQEAAAELVEQLSEDAEIEINQENIATGG